MPKMKSAVPSPTALELEILKTIWQRGHATVREVFQDLAAQRKIAYTTVLTMMGILERKGHLNKKQGDRAYVYTPVESQDKVVANMIDEFVGRVFDGSARTLLLHLVEDRKIDPKELDEIEALLQARRKAQPCSKRR
jgi:BlaI family transcriptional regulator, penicillinase repressor